MAAKESGRGGAVGALDMRKIAEQRFSGLLEFAPDGILAVDGEGRILLANGEAERLFGYDSQELPGMPVENLIPERFRATHVHHRGDYMKSPRVRPMGLGRDLSARRRDGSDFPCEISLSTVPLVKSTGFGLGQLVVSNRPGSSGTTTTRPTAASRSARLPRLRPTSLPHRRPSPGLPPPQRLVLSSSQARTT